MENTRRVVTTIKKTKVPSNFRSHRDLDSYLNASSVTGIEGIDTRALVRHIRDKGAMRACLSTTDLDEKSVVEKAHQFAQKDPSCNCRPRRELLEEDDQLLQERLAESNEQIRQARAAARACSQEG